MPFAVLTEEIPMFLGFMQGVCTSAAIERLKQRPPSQEIADLAVSLQEEHGERLNEFWLIISKANEVFDVYIHLLDLFGEAADDAAKYRALPMISGFAIGVAAIGYTPVVVGSSSFALNLLNGELWLTKPLALDGPKAHQEPALRLSERVGETGKLVYLRWSGDQEWGEELHIIKGNGLPEGFRVPALILSET